MKTTNTIIKTDIKTTNEMRKNRNNTKKTKTTAVVVPNEVIEPRAVEELKILPTDIDNLKQLIDKKIIEKCKYPEPPAPVDLNKFNAEEYKENFKKIYKSVDEIKATLKTREDVKKLRDKILEDRKTPILRDSLAFEAIEARRKHGRMLISNYNYNIERWVQRFNKLVADNNVFPDTISALQEEINDGYASDLNIEKAENFNELIQLGKDINNVKYTEYFDLKKFIVDYNKYSLKRIFNKYFNIFKKVKSDTDDLLCVERPALAKNINNLRRFDMFINKEIVITNESIEYLDLMDVQDNWTLIFNPKIVLYKISLKNDKLIYTCTRQSINCY